MLNATRRAPTDKLLTTLNAVLAQLVERDLAKVEVTSSSLVYRSNLIYFPDIHFQIAKNDPYANHYKFNLCNFFEMFNVCE